MSEKALISVDEMSDGSRTLRLVGELSVYHATDLHRVAIALAQHDADVCLDCRELQSVDLAVAQILLALKRVLSLQGRCCRIGKLTTETAELLRLIGLGQDATPSLGLQVGNSEVESARAQIPVPQA
jgi:anti-anti-sigma regulatory factor